jgi:hypothetical protein
LPLTISSPEILVRLPTLACSGKEELDYQPLASERSGWDISCINTPIGGSMAGLSHEL